MILAAAIKYKIKKTNKTVVLCGARHGDIFKQLHDLGFGPKSEGEFIELEQGFIDHHNKFLSREQAFKHAKRCGQLADKIIYERENGGVGGLRLISEDLW